MKIKAASVFSSFKQASRPEKRGWFKQCKVLPTDILHQILQTFKEHFHTKSYDLDINLQHISDLSAKKKSVDTCMP